MKCSKEVVGFLKRDREVAYIDDDEKFLFATFICKGETYKVIGSEYVLGDIEGRVRLTVALLSRDFGKGGEVYINVLLVDKVTDDVEDIMNIDIGGVVVYKSKLKAVKGTCTNIIYMHIRYADNNKRPVYVPIVVYGKTARKLQGLQKGQVLTGSGYLKYHDDKLELALIDNISSRDRKERC